MSQRCQPWNITIDLSVWNMRNTSFNRVLGLMPSCKGGAQNLISSTWGRQPGQSKDCVCLSESWMAGWAPTVMAGWWIRRCAYASGPRVNTFVTPPPYFNRGAACASNLVPPNSQIWAKGLGANSSLGIHRLTTSRGFTPSPMAPMCNWRPTVCQSPYRATC